MTAVTDENVDISDFYVDLLLSYFYNEKTDIADVKQAVGPNGIVVIDSGAFSAFTRGMPVNIDAYAEWLQHWRGYVRRR